MSLRRSWQGIQLCHSGLLVVSSDNHKTLVLLRGSLLGRKTEGQSGLGSEAAAGTPLQPFSWTIHSNSCFLLSGEQPVIWVNLETNGCFDFRLSTPRRNSSLHFAAAMFISLLNWHLVRKTHSCQLCPKGSKSVLAYFAAFTGARGCTASVRMLWAHALQRQVWWCWLPIPALERQGISSSSSHMHGEFEACLNNNDKMVGWLERWLHGKCLLWKQEDLSWDSPHPRDYLCLVLHKPYL